MAGDFSRELERRVLEQGRAPAVVGLDPRADALPRDVAPGQPPAARIVAFYEAVLPVLARHVPMVKPNVAFFEAHGADGWRAYETTCRAARAAGLLVLADVKRGDIGATAEAYAQAHFALADAVTLHPLLGSDSLAPFLARCRDDGKGVFVLVRTSNPSASELQDLRTPDGTLSEAIARLVHRWGAELGAAAGYSPVGAVVGATWPKELAALRALMPRAWLLLPGTGAQGGRVADLGPAFDARGLGALVAQSRTVLQAFAPGERAWLARVDEAAAAFARDVQAVARR
jgi:orotidine-5'-phosphate decarboxylase